MAQMKMRPVKMTDEAWSEIGDVSASVRMSRSAFIREATTEKIAHTRAIEEGYRHRPDATGTP